MSIFGRFRRKKHHKTRSAPDAEPRPNETAPGVRAIKELWAIDTSKPVRPVEGEVVTDIYATQRPNGMPRRRHLSRDRADDAEFTPPY